MILLEVPNIHCHLCYSKLNYKFKVKDAVPNMETDVIIFTHDRNIECNQMNFKQEISVKDFLVSTFHV